MVWALFSRVASKYPFWSQTAVATSKSVVADAGTQRYLEKRDFDEMDWRRTAVFGTFGFVYLGFFQYGVYVKGFEYLFNKEVLNRFCNAPLREKMKDKEGLRVLGKQIAFDFVVLQPFIYWPCYYTTKEMVKTTDLTELANKEVPVKSKLEEAGAFSTAMAKYKKTFLIDNFGMLGFWLPADIIIYSIPMHLRLHLTHLVSFGWTVVVSLYRGD
mmetsp:Transcript_5802/g.11629  ORF Transcript_5802/g.11629 Transcript_5802/m.11629 type:complete len:214 (+) Transcript_5802:72-713(+)|eukprot:CAMPEP_0118662722 /NCGR_PEP_ID=MMETSP0785-20121206/16993_1 /TAXON_ID=91992 /ORGANISM="Bolidomonas pacifica, Strain CCMP 1866" /LENGTH=213 /DNA_ID=CAMNT_0006556305 /DNA_START=52 /DNA_END=693 /DNA_ORIENTATION=+